jgi:Protein of unknown function (DUF3592)
VLIAWSGSAIHEGLSSAGWPTASGTILTASVERETYQGKLRYRLDLSYRFTVEGRTVQAQRATVDGPVTATNPSEFNRLCARYPAGSTADVHFPPGAPERALLEPGVPWRSPAIAAAGVLLLVFGFWLLQVGRPKGPAPG